MNPMQADNAKFLLEFLLPQLKSEQAVTEKILAAVPAEAGGYKPGEKSMTAFALARHLALCELWFLDAVLNGEFGEAEMPPASAATCRDVAEWFAEGARRRVALLRQLPAAALIREVDYIGLRRDPAVAYLNIAIRHSVHHRGQMAAYLRGMGAAVPAIYVESADEPYPTEDGSVVTPPAF